MVHKLYELVVTFIQKLKLIQSQLVLKKVVHCPVLSSRPTDTVQNEKYSDLVTKLADDFEKRFQDFRRHIGTMKLISNPFSIDPTDAADKYQLELIDIFRMTAEHDLLNFYSLYHQISIPISHRTPGSSLLCSELPTVANNCFLE